MELAFTPIQPTHTSGRIRLGTHDLAGPILILSAPGGDASLALEGGHVIAWTPREQRPVLWLSPGRPGPGKALRGGVPVCWPWFADHASDPTKPAHGFVRTRTWRVDQTEVSQNATRVTLSTGTEPGDAGLWPHLAQLELVVTLADTLALDLTTRNVGDNGFELTQALHSYFAVSEASRASVDGFDGQAYADKLDGFRRKTQSSSIMFTGEVDRVYDEHGADGHSATASLLDPGWQRRITITKSGSRSSVVWNPAARRGAQLGDLGVEGWRRYVCVETCNAGLDVIRIEPGQSHTLSAKFAVSAY
jgi:glucose-6-phosphate 1-epimerase